MTENQTATNSYLQVTSAGAYHCSSGARQDSAQKFIAFLLSCNKSPQLSDDLLTEHLHEDLSTANTLIKHMYSLGWLELKDTQSIATMESLEDLLPQLLPSLSTEGKAMLSDTQGFYISSTGFPHETAEELAALSADLNSLQERHKNLVSGNLSLTTNNWSLVDAGGYSRLGFWPIHISNEIFTLIISGPPKLEHPNFLALTWALFVRYSSTMSRN
ncbi:MAG: hypothetical protein KUG72_10665 [Pseudomonadales bacterium]|nr:hypothetical protein [Pseudomonadales bacterium]